MLQLPSRFLTRLAAPIVVFGAAVTLAAALAAPVAHADDNQVIIDVNAPQRSLYPIAVPLGVNSDARTAKLVDSVASFDLGVAGWFKVLNPASFLANLHKEGLSINPRKWSDVGAFGVIKYRATVTGGRVQLVFRLFEVQKGAVPVLEKTYTGSVRDVRDLVHKWCNQVVEYYTHEPGFFGSKLAFVTRSRHGKRIMVMDFDGYNIRSLTRNRYINILPAWSPSGNRVAFTSYMRDNPDLYVVGAGGGRPRRISHRGGMNTGASWSPDGSKLAVTLSIAGNAEIYIIDASSGRILRRLTHNRAIDTSAAWSPDGRQIAFVSDREGGPQIFVMNADGSHQHRVSMNGSYNTAPTWSPLKGKHILAYTTRAGRHFDIVTLDLDSGKMVRITQNEGQNEEPAFSPNGRAIAFTSVRRGGSGIYIANADGTGKATRVWRGHAWSVSWGPAPK